MQVQSTIEWKISTFYCMYEYGVVGTLMKNICDGSDWGLDCSNLCFVCTVSLTCVQLELDFFL
jgi:hypothetical protein